MKKILTSLVTLIFLLGSLVGCKKPLLDPKNPVTLTMWHNYGGDMQASIDILIDQFNSTVGKEKGILINVAEISSSSELNEQLGMIANGDPGAPEMPDIFTGYPKIAIQFYQKNMLANFEDYFTQDELAQYVDAFIEEGRLSDGGLYVFPIAKSTEVLYLNQTLFDQFAQETGANISSLATFEGIAEISELYYAWTDAKTPEEGDGKTFFTADSWFNIAEVGMAQLGDTIFDGEKLSLEKENFERIFNTFYNSAVNGSIAIYDGYSSDLSKTGDIVCSTGSSAGMLFYGDTITHKDGTEQKVEYSILPYPTFENGTKTAIQRGGGLMIAKSTEQKEYAASIFIKWLTSTEPNMKFIDKTGYLPVTKQAFTQGIDSYIQTIQDSRVQKLLSCVLNMYKEYTFFTAPTYANFDNDSNNFELKFKTILTKERNNPTSSDEALNQLRD